MVRAVRAGKKDVSAYTSKLEQCAKYLNGITFIHALYGAFDGYIISYSTFRLFLNLFCPPDKSPSNMMHNFLSTPGGLIAAASESLAIIALSMLGNALDSDYRGYELSELPGCCGLVKTEAATDREKRQVEEGNKIIFIRQPGGKIAVGYRTDTNQYATKEIEPSHPLFNIISKSPLGVISNQNIWGTMCPLIESLAIQIPKPSKTKLVKDKSRNKLIRTEKSLAVGEQQEEVSLEKGKLYLEIETDPNDENNHWLRYTCKNWYGQVEQGTITARQLKQAHKARLAREGLEHEERCCDIIPPMTLSEFIPLLPDILTITSTNKHAQDRSKRFYSRLSWFWPYFRDAFKGLKFAANGLRNAIMIFGFSLMLPMVLAVGVVAAINRIWNRHMVSLRKEGEVKNNELLVEAEMIGGYDFSDSVNEGEHKKNVIYLSLNDGLTEMKYRVYNSKGKLQEGNIDFKKLKYTPNRGADGNFIKPSAAFLKEYYYRNILQLIAEQGIEGDRHIEVKNTASNRARIMTRLMKQNQSKWKRVLAFASAAYGGLVDGAYTYLGLLGIFPLGFLSMPISIGLSMMGILFTAVCIITRCYEEFDYQNKLIQSRLSVELQLMSKEIEELFFDLQQLFEHQGTEENYQAFRQSLRNKYSSSGLFQENSMTGNGLSVNDDLNQFCQVLDRGLENYLRKNNELQVLLGSSYRLAVVTGLRSGLYVYTAISSFMTATVTFYLLASAQVSLSFVLSFVLVCSGLGLASLALFVGLAVYQHYKVSKNKLQSQPIVPEIPLIKEHACGDYIRRIKDIINDPDKKRLPDLIKSPIIIKDAIVNGMKVDGSDQGLIQAFAEWLRATCSAGSKGPRMVNYVINYWHELTKKGDFQDTIEWYSVGVGLSVAASLTYSTRTYAKQFSKPVRTLPVDAHALDLKRRSFYKSGYYPQSVDPAKSHSNGSDFFENSEVGSGDSPSLANNLKILSHSRPASIAPEALPDGTSVSSVLSSPNSAVSPTTCCRGFFPRPQSTLPQSASIPDDLTCLSPRQ